MRAYQTTDALSRPFPARRARDGWQNGRRHPLRKNPEINSIRRACQVRDDLRESRWLRGRGSRTARPVQPQGGVDQRWARPAAPKDGCARSFRLSSRALDLNRRGRPELQPRPPCATTSASRCSTVALARWQRRGRIFNRRRRRPRPPRYTPRAPIGSGPSRRHASTTAGRSPRRWSRAGRDDEAAKLAAAGGDAPAQAKAILMDLVRESASRVPDVAASDAGLNMTADRESCPLFPAANPANPAVEPTAEYELFRRNAAARFA